jgi:hypothetical protein
MHLGALHRSLGRLPEAETAYADAQALLKQLAAEFPQEPDYRVKLARSHQRDESDFSKSVA